MLSVIHNEDFGMLMFGNVGTETIGLVDWTASRLVSITSIWTPDEIGGNRHLMVITENKKHIRLRNHTFLNEKWITQEGAVDMSVPSYLEIYAHVSQMTQPTVNLSYIHRQLVSPTGKASRMQMISLLHLITFLSMWDGSRPAEFSFQVGYRQALLVRCICFVKLSAFKGVVGSISYLSFNVATEAIEFSGFEDAQYLTKNIW